MARGLRDTHYFLKTRCWRRSPNHSICSGLLDHDLFLVPASLVSSVSSICVVSLRFISASLIQGYSGNGICPVSYWDGSEFPVTKPERTLRGTGPLAATGGGRPNPLWRNSTATTRVFLFQKSEI